MQTAVVISRSFCSKTRVSLSLSLPLSLSGAKRNGEVLSVKRTRRSSDFKGISSGFYALITEKLRRASFFLAIGRVDPSPEEKKSALVGRARR